MSNEPMGVTGKRLREEISNGQIKIVRYRKEHLERVYEATDRSRAELMPWMVWLNPAYDLEDARVFSETRDQRWNEGSAYSFIIEDQQTGELLGVCGLSHVQAVNRRANLGYWVRADKTGRGVATAAARLLAEFGFQDVGLVRIEVIASIKNLASCRVAKKLGAKTEGTLRSRLLLPDGYHDAIMHSLLASDLAISADSLPGKP